MARDDDDDRFESIAKEDDDASYSTADDENQLLKYLTDTLARRNALSDLYVENEENYILLKIGDTLTHYFCTCNSILMSTTFKQFSASTIKSDTSGMGSTKRG
eukprot:6350224-Ditylum_brightwellii.AAC.1